jgi:hypothetical protein
MIASSSASLKLTTALQYSDVVDMFTCSVLHRVCNGVQFESMKGTDFALFLNLRETSESVVVRDRENRRVCYLINRISKCIRNTSVANEWIIEMLKRCNISYNYYHSHYSSVGSGTSRGDKLFAKSLNEAFEVIRNYTMSTL